jgi:UDP-N-acetyl-D-glucosamine dehydrogenase
MEERSLRSQDLMPAVKDADLVLIVTDHSAFQYPQIVEAARVVLDTRNATRGLDSEKILKI